MFVADFQNYIAPLSNQNKPTRIETQRKTATPFILPKQQVLPQTPLHTAVQHPEYIYSRNYFANKERFSTTPKPYEKPLKEFTKEQKQKALPDAYAVAFTTLLDVTKPKPALIGHFRPNDSLDSNYQTLQKEAVKKQTAELYTQNDSYFKRAYAA